MQRELWGAHPFVWAGLCGLVALMAILLAVTVLGDPHRSARRSFLLQCREQVEDRGLPNDCSLQARRRFGRFDSRAADIALGVAGLAVFAGTLIVVLFVIRRVGEAVEQPG